MNHDYAHCADFTDDCPKDCFIIRNINSNRTNIRI